MVSTTEPEIGRTSSDEDNGLRTEKLAEYVALRDEIAKRLELRNQVLNFALVLAGVFLTVGTQGVIKPDVVLLYPVLVVWLVGAWAHSDVRIGQISEYIRDEVERLPGIGWEGHIQDRYRSTTGKSKLERFKSALLKNLVEIYAAGIFLSTELLAVFLAVSNPTFRLEVTNFMFLLLDLAAVVFTVLLISLRRAAYRVKNENIT